MTAAARPEDDAAFWRACCEHGVTICRIPKPMRESVQGWVVVKVATFRDDKEWVATHTFDSFDELYRQVRRYLATGEEPGYGR